MAAILLLISIVNEKENKSINSTENYVSYLLSALRTALQSPDFYSSNHRHHLHDLIRGLNKLTRFDANKRLLLEGEILGDISKMLSIAKNLQNSKPDEFSQNPVSHVDPNKLATEVVRLLWQLCFLSETREQLLQDTSLIALCRDLNASSFSTTFREAVEGLFWSLSKPLKDFETAGSLNSSPLSTTANPYGHIVFACSRTNHHRVIDDLKLALRDRGYNVYIESDRMHMEDALADASALILCLSYSFSTSPFCRQQVLSALSHRVALIPVLLESNYEPEAWLHYLLATVIYTSFTDRDDPEQATEFLSLALAKYGIVRQTCDVDGALLNEPPHALVASPEAVAFQRPKSACADSSNSSTPTPSKCATQANLQDLQPPPFSRCSPTHTSESRLESSSYSVSQMSSMWSHCEESATSSKLEDSAIALAYQAPSAEIKSWSASRVRRWLEENGLSNYAPALLWLDGTLLWELAWHRIRSCDSFFCNLDYHLKMPPQDQMTFYNALSLLRDAT
ncbi:unnamed protein product [Mesocestoides corti]|uniref:TIR domain-containing protein n=1 Tax=Mesocestoides corti TaxID=53468 RepID=A0A0R3UL19_MESCO|nr:unnamed protein product [Mesocestoides corti]